MTIVRAENGFVVNVESRKMIEGSNYEGTVYEKFVAKDKQDLQALIATLLA